MVGGSKQLGRYLAPVMGIRRSHWPLQAANRAMATRDDLKLNIDDRVLMELRTDQETLSAGASALKVVRKLQGTPPPALPP